jgi:phage gp29-like protein
MKLKKQTDPADRVSVMSPLQELPNVAMTMTADRLVEILTAAENGDTRELFALYRDVVCDSHIQAEFSKRKAAILGDPISLIPFDADNPQDVAAKDLCEPLVSAQTFRDAFSHLLNSTLWPVSVVEKVYAASGSGFTLSELVPVHYQLLDFTKGPLHIYDVDESGRPLSTSHPADPDRYIVHRAHLMPIPDRWGGPMRSLLFWWMLRSMTRQWWGNFLERFGIPFLKGKYKDSEGRAVLERAFASACRLGAIVVSQGTEAEIVQAAKGDSSASYEQFIELCNREISKLILGQTLSSTATPTGIGGGATPLQSEVRDDLRKLDAASLAQTIQSQLFAQFMAVNNSRGRAPIILFGSDSATETATLFATVKGLSDAGFEPDDDGLSNISKRVGFGVRRKAVQTPSPFGFHALPLSAPAVPPVPDQVAEKSAVDLSAAFRGHLAPVGRIIRESKTPDECLSRVREWAASVSLSAPSDLIAQALTAYAASGLTSVRQPE